ncbi:serine hydrolase [uncultured Eudoraea sp.]|uniref:serine hydrolase domain-containing protein n=1 Tax=uncultured Eudoraea sp. TaxID=1035614 RepID=UPI00260808BC|nr:serine hydrolase domain-containing protein [uncultured Eudoraea sp.]
MTIRKQHYILFFLLSLLISCNSPQTAEQKVETPTRLVSKTYRAPIFSIDNRLDKIKSIAPQIHEMIEAHALERKIPGVAYGIVVDNKLEVSAATGLLNINEEIPATTKSAFRIASMSKSFTAMAIIKLRDEGKLSLNDPVEQYIPEMAGLEYLTADAPVIDIENLMTMTAGFPEDNPWGDRQLDESDEMLTDLLMEGVSFSNPPSYKFEYSNTGYALLGNIISRVSGMPYQQYINENILHPLGMKQTYWEFDKIPKEQLAIGYRWEDDQWKLEPMLHDGSYGAMGGLITSIEDFSKYVSFHLSAWPPRSDEDRGPVKRSSIREMHTPQYSGLNAEATDFNGDPCPSVSGYGYGLGIHTNCKGLTLVRHGGALPGFGSNYVFYPAYGIGIMAFGNLTYTSPWPLKKIEKLLFETLELTPRKLPVSNILMERQQQVNQLIQTWNPDLERELIAENFYLDKSREHRMAEVKEIFEEAGAVISTDEIHPYNQLRGSYYIEAENGVIQVYFTLTPEKEAKLQQLYLSFESKEIQK